VFFDSINFDLLPVKHACRKGCLNIGLQENVGKVVGFPAPLLAIMGMVTAFETADMRAWSKPLHCPSISMQFSIISPAPSASTALATVTAQISRASRPPLTVH